MAKYLNNRVKDLKVGVAGKTDSENVLEVSGNVVATKFTGDGSGLNGVIADQAGIKLENDGSLVGTATTVNFSTGIEVSTVSSGFATVTVAVASGDSLFVSNDTGIHTTSNVGIGTTTADGSADPNNTTILNVGIVTANYFYGDGTGITSLTDVSADTYGSGDYTPVITVDSTGRITGITTAEISGSGAIANVSEDTTPELGGSLNAAGYGITNVGIITANNIEISGISTFLGNVGIGTTNASIAADTNNTTILNAGIVTANYFYGDGTGLTGLQGAQFDALAQDTTPQLGGDLDLNNRAITGIGTINITGALGGDYLAASHGSTVTLAVTVATKTAAHRYNGSGSSNGYLIDGVEAPFLTLTPGRTYRFDQSDSSNSGHRLRFYLESNKTTEYTTNVTISGSLGSDGYTEIVVTDETPIVLHYQCESHEYMGNGAQTNSNYIKTAYDSIFLGNVGVGTTNAASNSTADTNNTTILNAGIVTANYYYGNGAGLTGLAGAQFDAVSQDTNPSLGGNLNAAGYNITNVGIITGDNFIISGISSIGTGITFYASSGIISATKFYGDISEAEGSGISDISADTTPTLGGDLDGGTYSIYNVGIATASSFNGELHTTSLLKEEVNSTSGKLSDNTNIDIANGMVHYFTTTETTTSTPNIRYNASNSLNSKMSNDETVSVNIITTAAVAGYSTAINIDGTYQQVKWNGGVIPYVGNTDGNDIYSFQILKTADSTFQVYGSLTNLTSNPNNNPRQITVGDEGATSVCFPVFTTAATGTQAPKTDASSLTYNSTTGQLSSTSFKGDGSSLAIGRWNVSDDGSNTHYQFTGPGGLSSSNDPTLYLARGQTYEFNIDASGHPFHIQTSSGAYNASNLYTTGVTNAGAAVGVVTFAIPFSAPNTLYYVCQNHSNMAGTITVFPTV